LSCSQTGAIVSGQSGDRRTSRVAMTAAFASRLLAECGRVAGRRYRNGAYARAWAAWLGSIRGRLPETGHVV